MVHSPDSTPGDGDLFNDTLDLSDMSLEELRTTQDPRIILGALSVAADVQMTPPEEQIMTD